VTKYLTNTGICTPVFTASLFTKPKVDTIQGSIFKWIWLPIQWNIIQP
jgi:hypothetical protein